MAAVTWQLDLGGMLGDSVTHTWQLVLAVGCSAWVHML